MVLVLSQGPGGEPGGLGGFGGAGIVRPASHNAKVGDTTKHTHTMLINTHVRRHTPTQGADWVEG